MKILMVTPYFHPIKGGTESFVEGVSLKLNKVGIQTDVLTFNFAPQKARSFSWKESTEHINGLRVKKVSALQFRPLEFFQVNFLPMPFRRILKDYDIIHFHNDVDLTFPLFSYFIKKPKLFHLHCLDTTFYDCYSWNFIARHILINTANIYIVLSNMLRKMLMKLNVPESKIRIVPNGIDVSTYKPGTEMRRENTIVFVGRITQKKGLNILLQSLKYLNHKVNLKIIGPLSFNQSYSKNVLNVAKKINKKQFHNIDYLGTVDHTELIKWYQNTTILVMPSLSESFPMVMLEALACGAPLIATDVGAVGEVVKNHSNGIITQSGDPIRLAKDINYLLDNEDIRKNFSINGRQTINDHYSMKAVAKNISNIYQEILFQERY